MLEIRGDLWKFWEGGAFVCVTTNGVIKRKDTKELVMGAGIAGQAQDRFSGVAVDWGKIVLNQKAAWADHDSPERSSTIPGYRPGDGPHVHFDLDRRLIMFPTKHLRYRPSDLGLIERSCRELTEGIRLHQDLPMVYLPRPGCGLGRLDWETQVKPVISKCLSDRVTVISF